jgi:phage/plasmid primase-like uncharacterized protein
VQIPSTVQRVVICADHDHNQVGLQAAQALAGRLLQDGRQVTILLPDTVGTDWLDVCTDPQADPLTLARIAATPEVRPDAQAADEPPPAIVHHVLPEYLAQHPDPRVHQHWQRIYRKANARKQQLVQDTHAAIYRTTPGGGSHGTHN